MEEVMENAGIRLATNEVVDEKKDRHANVDFKMVTFSLDGKDYAIDILKVKEIAKADRFTYVPNTAPFVVGVYNLRGEIIPIIDLRIFFNLEVIERTEHELENMIIVGFGDQKYGTVVDRIEKVVGIQKSAIQPPHPLFGDINIKYIYGIIEDNDRLYILLDVDKIFGVNQSTNVSTQNTNTGSNKIVDSSVSQQSSTEHTALHQKNKVLAQSQKMDEVLAQMKQKQALPKEQVYVKTISQNIVPPTEIKIQAQELAELNILSNTFSGLANADDSDFKFVVDSLRTLQHFYMSSLNSTWLLKRFSEWKSTKGNDNLQLTDKSVAKTFLVPFYSQCSSKFWTKEYADAIYAILPENSSRQIQVWNPGCGVGYEAYSLACLLHKRYPNARVKIYAHDNDLLTISNAALLRIPEADANGWYKPYITKTVSGELLFSTEIRESVLFEYHDCTHMNITPDVDMIFSREFLSFIPESALENILVDFYEKIKENGVVIIGDNEILVNHTKWLEKIQGSIVVYNKQ